MIFPLLNEEKEQLKRLNQNKTLVFALKKLFLNEVLGKLKSDRPDFLAAERIALNMVEAMFSELNTIQPDNQTGTQRENMV